MFTWSKQIAFSALTLLIGSQEQRPTRKKQEGQHPLTGQCAANFRLLANQ